MEAKVYKMSIINHKKHQDHVEYLIRLISMKDSSSIEFYERYSNLKVLNDNLKKETTSSTFPRFPPKKFFGSNDEKFLNQRQTELNSYFDSIFNSPEFSNLPSLRKWIDESIKKWGKEPKTAPKKEAPQVNSNVISTSVEQPKENQETASLKKLNDENELARCKDLIDSCSKAFIDLKKSNEPDLQEDQEKAKEYKQIFRNGKVFEKEGIKESSLFKIESGDDENFVLFGNDKEGFKKREEIARKLLDEKLKKYTEDIQKIYQVNDLIVPI